MILISFLFNLEVSHFDFGLDERPGGLSDVFGQVERRNLFQNRVLLGRREVFLETTYRLDSKHPRAFLKLDISTYEFPDKSRILLERRVQLPQVRLFRSRLDGRVDLPQISFPFQLGVLFVDVFD